VIIEVEDIVGGEKSIGHAPIRPGTRLGEVFAAYPMSELAQCVIRVDLNGTEVEDWRNIKPNPDDKIHIVIKPKFFLAPIIAFLGTTVFTVGGVAITVGNIISAIGFVISIVTTLISIFSKPTVPKAGGHSDSPTYSFDGIKTQIQPGNPIPVLYGQGKGGGQVLSAFVDVTSSGKRQNLSMLIGYGWGPITAVNCVHINDVPIEDIKSASYEVRLGGSSQAPIAGFDQVRNTFSDGREIASGFPIVYQSVTGSLTAIQFQIAANEGLVKTTNVGEKVSFYVDYGIEWRPTGASTFTTLVATRRFKGKTHSGIWDVSDYDTNSPGPYDYRFTFLGQAEQDKSGTPIHNCDIYDPGGKARGRIWLSNVTEKEKLTYAFSGIAHIAIKALATSQLHGQLPNVTAITQGRPVDVYSTTAVKTTVWTQNPAWCIADYMTNSTYGIGAYIRIQDLNLQSFIDFATLCNSQVPNGNGGLEDQHHLDVVMDVRKSHWQWIQEFLGLYKSGMIYSQQQWKIITDRQDLPLRQVFHSGNILKGRMEIRNARDPMKPNQANVNFANQLLTYERDTIYVQDSASIFGAGEPIRDYDLNAFGIARESEVIRLGKWDLARKNTARQEIQFETGLEGIVVEPGDMCRVGILATDYEIGYGGRALDGSSSHIVLDREITVKSGYAYDLFIWHIEADTPETRTIATTVPVGVSCFTTIAVSPTSGFAFQVRPNDRYAIGITSEDLILCQVKKVARTPNGTHEITAEKYFAINPATPTEIRPVAQNVQMPAAQASPAQPSRVKAVEYAQTIKDGTTISNITLDVTPAFQFEGGRITVPATLGSVTLSLAGSHNPNADALVGEKIRFNSGADSGNERIIRSYAGMPSLVASIYPPFAAANVPHSGDPYQIRKGEGLYAGVDVYVVSDSGETGAAYQGSYLGTEVVVPITAQQSFSASYKLVPYSDQGVRNENGTWTVSITTAGDTTAPPQPGSIFIVRSVGFGAGVNVIPTSCADLWGHIFYRNTVDSFTTAQTIGFASQALYDTGITFAQTYFYYAAPVDFSFNVGSWIGPATYVQSYIVTTDIDSNAVSNMVTYNGGQVFVNSGVITQPYTIAFVTITTKGGPVLLIGGFGAFSSVFRQPNLSVQGRLAVDTPGHGLQDRTISFHGQDAGNANDAYFDGAQNLVIMFNYLDPTSAGVHTYYIGGAGGTVSSYNTSGVLLQAIELKR
jgi:hypothetical protein